MSSKNYLVKLWTEALETQNYSEDFFSELRSISELIFREDDKCEIAIFTKSLVDNIILDMTRNSISLEYPNKLELGFFKSDKSDFSKKLLDTISLWIFNEYLFYVDQRKTPDIEIIKELIIISSPELVSQQIEQAIDEFIEYFQSEKRFKNEFVKITERVNRFIDTLNSVLPIKSRYEYSLVGNRFMNNRKILKVS